MKYLLIKCARCDHAVDLVEMTEALEVPGWRIEVRCHGARDVMVLSSEDVERLRHGDGPVDAIAFRPVAMIPVSDRPRCDEETTP